MGKVIVLPQEVVSKIAAGEVIERPASVVKELVENSLDASSTVLNIQIKNAGKALIRVQDNGTGIEEDDLEKIFLRHTTSKIKTLQDLYQTTSLGFRGEALYSIASISDIIVKSKTTSSPCGWQLHLRGNKKIDIRPVTINNGTDIEVRELFYNTPARKKFMKSNSTELYHIVQTIIPYCLLHPHIEFNLFHHNKKLIDLPLHKNYVERTAKTLNLPQEEIIEVHKEYPQENVIIHLLLGNINIRRPRRDMQFIFINGRPVKNTTLTFQINRMYRILMPNEIYPFFAIFLDLPPENVDVNVHPSKREVKIKNEQYLSYLINSLCENYLLKKSKPKVATYTHPQKENISSLISSSSSKVQQENHYLLFPAEKKYYPSTTENDNESLVDKLTSAKYAGSIFKKYLLFECPSSLLIMDQHAAQERITYEELLDQITAGNIEKQNLLQPLVINLSPAEMIIWEKIHDKLEETGFNTTRWSSSSIALHSYPHLTTNPENIIHSILGELKKEKDSIIDKEFVARLACRSSLMAGYDVNEKQAVYIKDKILSCKVPFTCPHGRPTVIEINEKFLNREFLRE